MRGMNNEVVRLTDFALANDLNISFIEEMPLGEVGYDCSVTFLSSADIKSKIEEKYSLESYAYKTDGPAVWQGFAYHHSRWPF
ncbi:MAG: cyclic pyranopterin phosphate synthase [Oleispira sp.]|jgi:cyclic pyranopterin phosphate synthase